MKSVIETIFKICTEILKIRKSFNGHPNPENADVKKIHDFFDMDETEIFNLM